MLELEGVLAFGGLRVILSPDTAATLSAWEITMPDAVIVSTARTPIGRAYRGAFNDTHGATLGGHVAAEAAKRAQVAAEDIDDVLMGCAMPEGATGGNIARQIAVRAGFPVTVPGATINRFCSSGLQTIEIGRAHV